MKIGSLNTAERVVVVAEIGNNHEGSYALAEEMVGRAAEAGAHIVKFQTFCTEQFVARADEQRFRRLKGFELGYPSFEKLAGVARQAGALFMSTPLDLESARFLVPLVDALKVASSDNTFYPLLELVSRSGKPLIVSAGLAHLDEIVHSATLVRRVWRENRISQDLAVLHCVSAYPVPPAEANLGAIRALERALPGTVIGYSDHTLNIEACVLAVALGARIVEKHFTLNKRQSDFRDHLLSADPAEFALMVRRIAEVSELLGTGEKIPQPSEQKAEALMRRSIVAARDLPAGQTLTFEDLCWTRPSGGLRPGEEQLLLGRVLKAAHRAGDKLMPEHVA